MRVGIRTGIRVVPDGILTAKKHQGRRRDNQLRPGRGGFMRFLLFLWQKAVGRVENAQPSRLTHIRQFNGITFMDADLAAIRIADYRHPANRRVRRLNGKFDPRRLQFRDGGIEIPPPPRPPLRHPTTASNPAPYSLSPACRDQFHIPPRRSSHRQIPWPVSSPEPSRKNPAPGASR